jgi:hypothetical protein
VGFAAVAAASAAGENGIEAEGAEGFFEAACTSKVRRIAFAKNALDIGKVGQS